MGSATIGTVGEEPEPARQLLRAEVEAVLMVVEEPVTVQQLAQATETEPATVTDVLQQLRAEYDGEGENLRRGFQLREVAGGWRIYARAEHAEVLERFLVKGATAQLSQAALEALAVIAYQQPATRGQVAQVRGVNSDSVIRTLRVRGLIEEHSTDPLTQATLYQTTPYFLELLGLTSLEELPKLSPLLPGADQAADFEQQL